MLKKNLKLASWTLELACALVACAVVGCRRDTAEARAEVAPRPVNTGSNAIEAVAKPLPEVYVAEGNSFMHDPAYVAAMEEHETALRALAKRQASLNRRMKEISDKVRGDRKAAGEIAEYRELVDETKKLAAEFVSRREEFAKVVRARHARALEDSQRVARGEAVAKEISKVEEVK